MQIMFKCETCQTEFILSSDIISDQRQVHTKWVPYCPVCGKKDAVYIIDEI